MLWIEELKGGRAYSDYVRVQVPGEEEETKGTEAVGPYHIYHQEEEQGDSRVHTSRLASVLPYIQLQIFCPENSPTHNQDKPSHINITKIISPDVLKGFTLI